MRVDAVEKHARTWSYTLLSLSWFYIIPILGFLIFIHECGHFFAARMCGVKVEEFGMGIPPKVFGWVRGGVVYSINAIPFGGFVRVKGEDGENMEPDSMNAKSPAQRAFFLSAGIIMNILFAILLMIVVVGIKGVPHNEVYIAGVGAGSPAATAGWQIGDRIVSVDGEEVQTVQELIKDTRSRAGEPVQFVIERGGELYPSTLTPRENPPEGEGRIGINLADPLVASVTANEVAAGSPAADAGIQNGDLLVSANDRPITNAFVLQTELNRFQGDEMPLVVLRGDEQIATTIQVPQRQNDVTATLGSGFEVLGQEPIFEEVGLLHVIPRGFEEAWRQTSLMVDGIVTIVTNPELLRQTAGPVGMAQLTHELVETTSLPVWYTLASLTILLSINLAFLNLLPLPALDGGRLLFVLVELIRGRRIAPEKEGLVHLVGFIVLIGFMFVIMFNDIRRIISGDSFFG